MRPNARRAARLRDLIHESREEYKAKRATALAVRAARISMEKCGEYAGHMLLRSHAAATAAMDARFMADEYRQQLAELEAS
jgi:hypothetical protein